MMLSSLSFLRIYYHCERDYNAGTGNFVYVGQYCAVQVWPQMFKKMDKALFNSIFEKMVDF